MNLCTRIVNILVLTMAVAVSAHADFCDTLNVRSKGKGVWIRVNNATWITDTSEYTRGNCRLGMEVMIGNPTKESLTLTAASFVVRLGKDAKQEYMTALAVLGRTSNIVTISANDSVKYGMVFVIPETGRDVELRFVPKDSKSSVTVVVLPQVASPCQQRARAAEIFLAGMQTFKEYLDNRKRRNYDHARSLLLTYLKAKPQGMCSVERTSELDDLSKSALKIVNLDGQELNNIERGDRETISPMSFFATMAKRSAMKIVDEDFRK